MNSEFRIRSAGEDDIEVIAALHADSWRRNYRGAYADEFLDGDLEADRRTVWAGRLTFRGRRSVTLVAEEGNEVVGFAHVVPDEHPLWGELLDNLHVRHDRHGHGVGTLLLGHAARAAIVRGTGVHLWVQRQNHRAIRFYRARAGREVETAPITAPAGVPGRLVGAPLKIRYAWTLPQILGLEPRDSS